MRATAAATHLYHDVRQAKHGGGEAFEEGHDSLRGSERDRHEEGGGDREGGDKEGGGGDKTCFICGGPHLARNCPEKKKGKGKTKEEPIELDEE